MSLQIRAEKPADHGAVRAVNEAAFETVAEAGLVDALREQAQPLISLVAEQCGEIVGHILFSPVTIADYPQLKTMGLAPMAVLPGYQCGGVGSALVRAGLQACTQLGYGAVVVLGHPDYYPRFGFKPAAEFAIGCEYDVPPEAFMALELQPGYLRGASGTIQYHAAFAGL
jgi:putative acetyltransferase